MSLFIAKVVDVHPEGNTIDVTFAADGRWVPAIPVIGSALSGNTGLVDLPVPDLTTSRTYPDKHKSENTDKRDILAIIGDVDGVFVCLGFISPPVCEMNFPKEIGEERRIDRHASDVYAWTDKDGNTQSCHPNGSYATLGESASKLDLTEKDYDKKWRIKRNLNRVIQFFFMLVNGSQTKFTAWVKPDGSTEIYAAGPITITSDVHIQLTAPRIDLN